ncbi:hypothetical protein [Bradyrhizobium sp. B120]|uniref:hypothetical protein n=1 Tax=Bradyrhizobium sp. B120 TaxID=3410088 RepID=UPI003B97DF53
MPARYSHRIPGDLDLAMRVFQADSSWYENYWLKERKPRPAGMIARTLRAIVSCLRLATRGVLAIVTNAVWDAVDAERATDESMRGGR